MNSLKKILGLLLSANSILCAAQTPISFSAPGGLHTKPFDLVLTTDLQDAVIRFSTNGSLPNATSPLFEKPLKLRTTTLIRAAAFQNGTLKGEPITRSYLFLSDMLNQKGAGFPNSWGARDGKPIPADYEMDPEVVFDPSYRDLIGKGLVSIPTVSVVMDVNDLFGSHGIYVHPEESGNEWERPASLEFFGENGKAFQIDCGIRIQGGWNRRPEESPKHSFRLVFKKKYGPGKLKQNLFGKSAAHEFDTLILRSGCNNTWLHWNSVERKRGDFIRDQWMRDTLADMGQPSAAGLFVHLYLNGLYWGLYNLTERPDAEFAAARLGGKVKDYDAMNAEKIIEGNRSAWDELIGKINGGMKSEAAFKNIRQMLDLDNFIDFMIANLYGANADWDRHSNWYAAHRRAPEGRFVFFVWDAERTLEQTNDNTIDFDDDESPPRIFHRLCENPEFRRLFAERAKKHFSEGGTLSPERAAERYRRWVERIDLAIIAESARWGDYRRDAHPYKEGPYELYTRDKHWKPEVTRLLNDYFPARSSVVLKQFRAKGLYP